MASPAAVDRRRLLQAAVASAGGLWLPRAAWSQPRLSEDPFGLGVASGSPAHDSVVLWTRLMAPGSSPWPGLAPADLVDGDLDATTDYRNLLASVLERRCGASAGDVANVFPGISNDRPDVVQQRPA